jgi:hypothetical protein
VDAVQYDCVTAVLTAPDARLTTAHANGATGRHTAGHMPGGSGGVRGEGEADTRTAPDDQDARTGS